MPSKDKIYHPVLAYIGMYLLVIAACAGFVMITGHLPLSPGVWFTACGMHLVVAAFIMSRQNHRPYEGAWQFAEYMLALAALGLGLWMIFGDFTDEIRVWAFFTTFLTGMAALHALDMSMIKPHEGLEVIADGGEITKVKRR